MALMEIYPLASILIKTAPGLSADELPTFVLSEAVAVFQDGTFANLLADHAHRKVYIQGRVMLDNGNENHFKKKDFSGRLIKEEFTGFISHATGHLTIWVGIQDKWFEINPAESYRPIFDRMIHVLGIYWANDTFVDAGGKSAKLLDAQYAQASFVMIVCHYAGRVCGSSVGWKLILEMIDECGLWLENQCMLQKSRFDNTPLVLWLKDPNHAFADLGRDIANVVREMPKEGRPKPARPSAMFPNGIENFSDIAHVSRIVAMYILENKGLKSVTLIAVSFEVDRICSTGTAQAAASFMIHSRNAILQQLPAELNDSQLRAELENPDPLHDQFRTVHYKREKTKDWARWLKSGEKVLVRRKQKGQRVNTENKNQGEPNLRSDVIMSGWNTARDDDNSSSDGSEPPSKDGQKSNISNLISGGYHRGQVNIQESVGSSSFLKTPNAQFPAVNQIADFNNSTRPHVASNPHLAHVTSFGDGFVAGNMLPSSLRIDGNDDKNPQLATRVKRIKRAI